MIVWLLLGMLAGVACLAGGVWLEAREARRACDTVERVRQC